jgi:hypothetical protein
MSAPLRTITNPATRAPLQLHAIANPEAAEAASAQLGMQQWPIYPTREGSSHTHQVRDDALADQLADPLVQRLCVPNVSRC